MPRFRLERLEPRLAPAALTDFVTLEHMHLTVGYQPGDVWSLTAQDNDNGVDYVLDSLGLFVGVHDPAVQGPGYEFLGAGEGGTSYRLPADPGGDLLSVSFTGSFVSPSLVDRYNPAAESKGRLNFPAAWLRADLVAVEHTRPDGQPGNGHVAVWTGGEFSTPITVFMSSFDDGVANPNGNDLDVTDGISADDSVWFLAGGHQHFHWSFTEKGRYEVSFRVSGNFGDGPDPAAIEGTHKVSPIFTATFVVGSAGQLEFAQPNFYAGEGGNATVTVRRVGGSDGPLSVQYSTADGSAHAGADYSQSSGVLAFADGETSKTFTVPILADAAADSGETIALSLSSPGPGNLAYYIDAYVGDSLLAANSTAALVVVEPPTISSIAPFVGPTTGYTVTISGSNFTGATAVSFGGAVVAIAPNLSATTIVVAAPARALSGSVDVSVTNAAGTSNPVAHVPGVDQITYRTALQSIVVDDGFQGSVVRSITLHFNGAVNSAATGAIALTDRDGLAIPGLTLSVAGLGGDTLTLAFDDGQPNDDSGPVVFGSLADGRYRLRVDGSLLSSLGTTVDVPGPLAVLDFSRLFGDINGTGFVDATDLYPYLVNSIDKGIGDPGYRRAFDYNGNGFVDATDIYPEIVSRIDTGL